MANRISTTRFQAMKRRGEKIVMITAYDFPTASLVDEAGVDAILVGDSVGMAVLGHETTLPVTLSDILHHTKAVVRGTKHALVVADLPFLSYQIRSEEAVRNAGKLLKKGGATAVKVEGGVEICPQVSAMITAGIPVMGHLGLTPQSLHVLGGYKVQGRTEESAHKLMSDARSLESAGAFALVLELTQEDVAAAVTETVSIPTIGIGAGKRCDGQVLVLHDLLGITSRISPRFVKQYAQVGKVIREATEQYAREVRTGQFPGLEHSFGPREQVISVGQAKSANEVPACFEP